MQLPTFFVKRYNNYIYTSLSFCLPIIAGCFGDIKKTSQFFMCKKQERKLGSIEKKFAREMLLSNLCIRYWNWNLGT